MTKYIKCGGGGLPPQVITDMNAVLNKKFGTSTTYPSSEWADKIEEMTALPEESASGSIAHFEDGADTVPLKSCTLTLAPTQTGTGDPSPTNPRPITGVSSVNVTSVGKNLLPDSLPTNTINATFTSNGVITSAVNARVFAFEVTKNTNFIYSCATRTTIIIGTSDKLPEINDVITYVGTMTQLDTKTFNTGANKYIIIGIMNASVIDDFQTNKLMIELGSTPTAYEPYTTPTLTPVSLGQTVYGGEVEVVGGEVTDKYGSIDLSTLSWTYHAASGQYNEFFDCYLPDDSVVGTGTVAFDGYCSIYKSIRSTDIAKTGFDDGVMALATNTRRFIVCDQRYHSKNDFVAGIDGVILVYPLATPTTAQITPTEINSRYGVNNLWHDGNGDTSLTYRADIDLYVAEHS